MHQETNFDGRKLRKTEHEYYVEERIDRNRKKDDTRERTYNVVVSVSGLTQNNGTESARCLLATKRIVING